MLNNKMTGISMFSSAGIAETYLEDLNIDIRLANELIEERASYYSHFYPKVDMVVGDIMSPSVYETYIKKAKALSPKFLLATPPCQGMSSLGKKAYEEDQRNYLIFAVLRVIDELDLDVIAIENVPKFLKLYFPYEGKYLGIVDILKRKYSSRYIIDPVVVNAKDYGVPQSRPRAIIKLYKPGYKWDLPDAEKEITLREAIGYLPSLESGEDSGIKYHYALKHSAMHIEVMSHTPEGQSAFKNKVYYPKKADGTMVSGFHNTYNRMHWDLPCAAVTTNSGMISGHNNVHPGRPKPDGTYSDARVLTLLELIIVSSLPTDWNLPKDYKESLVRTIIGEAIPPRLLYKVLSTLSIKGPNDNEPKKKNHKPMDTINRADKKSKWTVMKYVNSFDLILQYADLIRDLNARVDDDTIMEINSIMKDMHIYQPKYGKPSVDTTNFKICQIVYFMFAYRNEASLNREIVYSPLGNLLLDNIDNKEWVAKIFATMLYGMPFNHPFNKMNPSFNLFPLRLIFKLLTDGRLNYQLYQDEVFYHIFWVKEIDEDSYEDLVKTILAFRALSPATKYEMFTERLSVQDTLANSLHETTYLFGQLESAGIATIFEGYDVGTLRQGGFGRGEVPDFISPEELAKHKPTGIRMYKTEGIRLNQNMVSLIKSLLLAYPYYEKPHDQLGTLGRQDYILHLYNFYPHELLSELGIKKNRIQTMLQITKNIQKYSRNQEEGDCYKFEDVLSDAFNEFDDVDAHTIGGAGNTDVECIYLTINEKFAIEAKSTQTKLGGINAGRLQLHRDKINAKYTIIVAPYYKPSVETDIQKTVNVMITASSLSNFLYQYTIHNPEGISYEPLYKIVQESLGTNITGKVNEYVAKNFGIGRAC